MSARRVIAALTGLASEVANGAVEVDNQRRSRALFFAPDLRRAARLCGLPRFVNHRKDSGPIALKDAVHGPRWIIAAVPQHMIQPVLAAQRLVNQSGCRSELAAANVFQHAQRRLSRR